MSENSFFNAQQLTALEHWNKRGFCTRATLLARLVDQLPETAELAKQKILLRALFAKAEHLEQANPLIGPTGESNVLYLTGRGESLVYGSESASPLAILGLVIAALMTGNAVILHAPQHAEWAAQLCRLLHQIGVPSNILTPCHDDSLAQLLATPALKLMCAACDVQEAIRLSRQLAAREGVLVPLVAETDSMQCTQLLQPDFLWRLVTEKTRTINTTAVGGNASLLALGSAAI